MPSLPEENHLAAQADDSAASAVFRGSFPNIAATRRSRYHTEMKVRIFVIVLTLCYGMLQGCGLLAEQASRSGEKAPAASSEKNAWPADPIPYTATVHAGSPGGRNRDGASLKKQMEAISDLLRLKDEPPDGVLGLERRARADAATALQLLHAQGYFDGAVSLDMQTETRPAKVALRLDPGPRYTVKETRITYAPAPVIPAALRHASRAATYSGISALWGSPIRQPLPPPDFSPVIAQLPRHTPAVADTILAAVERLPENLHRRGYPFAAITATRYLLDRETRTLDVEVDIDPGPPATLGDIRVTGNEHVRAAYLHRLLPWTPGEEPWNQIRMERFAESLRELGLFRSVEVRPALDAASLPAGEDSAAPLPIEVHVKETPAFRSLGAEAHYDTATGLGVNAHWEHRNAFGNGEKLTVDAPYSHDKKGLITELLKPAVGSRHTTLRGRLAALEETTDAYDKRAIDGFVRLEHRVNRTWWIGAGIGGEGGTLSENARDTAVYSYAGPNLTLRRDSRNLRVSPTAGSNIAFKISPYTGYYHSPFTACAKELDAALYFSPFKGGDNDLRNAKAPLVLAGRLRAGSLTGASLQQTPSPLRYFTGGASSVRGYAYQALGPKDKDGEPLGGLSYTTVNLETRFRITEDMGLVPFLDGGMAYRDALPDWFSGMRWGAGLGLRYFTPIGPLRLDVATPLHPEDGDAPLHVYVSIGQSF